ncbi:protein of unknown function [Kyrpidia spormannii]|uniref:acylphosphatase n=1 Tax=Kyrpidia spormannii TaxID=2055160 RepID=A0A6F9E6I9_9BACL|nr:protein of unknown function [Kyrpidia spormannii]
MTERVRVTVAGTVQGVGFRPFVYRLASEIGLTGEVCNRGSIVTVDVEGCGEDLAEFLRRLQSEAPPAARIDDLGVERLRPVGYQDLKIVSSEDGDRVSFGIPADLAICPDCLRDMAEPTSRYYTISLYVLHPVRSPVHRVQAAALRPGDHGNGGFSALSGVFAGLPGSGLPKVSRPDHRLPPVRSGVAVDSK